MKRRTFIKSAAAAAAAMGIPLPMAAKAAPEIPVDASPWAYPEPVSPVEHVFYDQIRLGAIRTDQIAHATEHRECLPSEV